MKTLWKKRNEAASASVSGDGCVSFSSCTAVNCKLHRRQNVTWNKNSRHLCVLHFLLIISKWDVPFPSHMVVCSLRSMCYAKIISKTLTYQSKWDVKKKLTSVNHSPLLYDLFTGLKHITQPRQDLSTFPLWGLMHFQSFARCSFAFHSIEQQQYFWRE